MRMQARYGYLLFILVMLLMSWDAQRNQAPLAAAAIPEESIRLRILANSDGANDQWLKRQVRDRVVDQMNKWVAEPMSLEEARALVSSNLDVLEQVVGNTIRESGASYTYEVQLGEVEFPAKLYGDRVYPAGLYEALVVTIGKGEGKNWWCVLFPPLCFVDTVSGQAAAEEAGEDVKDGESDMEGKVRESQEISSADVAGEMELRFFLVDWLDKLIQWIKGFFK
ncbi:stage II sporulation protein R [Xylanibacillus composti]|uniref:Stage II sporulation protein R n=1 Tax=Xylanibacillus composti TaxID=1572762 RepID=A0A8J4H8E2_9BACL|nr:stage II sporulation protein R [Xylanibacillus composti]MDT9726007.1 stage II sporulation protein R [Xylanibacillus composti]GIQ70838.1 stage II sporulation protein R [Xylanibacillus composti]